MTATSLTDRLRYWIELLASVFLATATTATAWSAYQSSLWNSEYSSHRAQVTTATVKSAKLTNLALQKTAVHVELFGQWFAAVQRGDRRLADFLLTRFPEPLRAATIAWQSTPSNVLEIPGSPFDLPQYALPETREAERWELLAAREADAADQAILVANRYLLFTIVFSSVLFFAGISGKCGLKAVDVAMLVLSAIALLVGMGVMVISPRM